MSPYISLSIARQKLDPPAMRFVASRLRPGVSADREPNWRFSGAQFGNRQNRDNEQPNERRPVDGCRSVRQLSPLKDKQPFPRARLIAGGIRIGDYNTCGHKSFPSARLIKSLSSAITLFASVAFSTWDAAAADLPAQQPAPAQPAVPAVKPCFASLYDFLTSGPDDCPLAWNGITLYGRLDYGAGYETHGVPFNGNYPNGVETLIKKTSNQPLYTIVPNGLGQSHIGVKGVEPIASDWSLVFKLENGFDPFTLQRANGPKSLVQNNTTPLDQQTANGDFESRRSAVQHRGLRRFQPSDVRRADRWPTELPHLAGSGRLRRHGRRARLLGDRRLEHCRRRGRHRERPLQHIGEI